MQNLFQKRKSNKTTKKSIMFYFILIIIICLFKEGSATLNLLWSKLCIEYAVLRLRK